MNMNFHKARENMIMQQIRANHVLDTHILDLAKNTPRELFVPTSYEYLAYAEMNIPIGHSQVMMTPSEECRMIQALQISKNDTVLEIGTGTGYVTSLLAQLAKSVYSVEIFDTFIANAEDKLNSLKLDNVTFAAGNAALGWKNNQTYDVIALTASTPLLAKTFLEQLNPGGRLFAIIGESPAMTATLYTHTNNNTWQKKYLFETVLPPLIHAPEPELFKF